MRRYLTLPLLILLLAASLGGCAGGRAAPSGGNGKLKVVATTTILADVVANVGGEAIDVSVLLPTGSDPHGFEPTPQDVAMVAQAEVIFANGAGLEVFLAPLLENAGSSANVVQVSDQIPLLEAAEHLDDQEDAGEQADESGDPHVWTDPNNVSIWVEAIQAELSEADPENAAGYQANAQAYKDELGQLDEWVQTQVDEVAPGKRKLVSDHLVFAYFAQRYGFEQVGAIVPGYSTLAQPSAQELAALEDAIRGLDVGAVFVGNTINPTLAERVSEDTGIQLVYVYTGSLSEPDGPAGTYTDFIRYNVNAIVEALK